MKYRVVLFTRRSKSYPYCVQKKVLGLFWKHVEGYESLETAFNRIETLKKWNEKKVWYSKDDLINEMAKVKEGDK